MHETDIPTKVLKENMDIFSPFLLSYFKKVIDSSSFSNYLKLANITPAHKKDSKQQTVFRRSFNVQHFLLVMLEKFRKSLDKCEDYAALIRDLSKPFDCIPHDLIITKIHAASICHC